MEKRDVIALGWPGKRAPDVTLRPAVLIEDAVFETSRLGASDAVYHGDAQPILAHLLATHRERVQLVYLDPPFDSAARYVRRVTPRGVSEPVALEPQFDDVWQGGDYLQFMLDRLALAHALLRDGGSLFLHCDHHRAHHLRCLLDEVFGEGAFRNAIAWCYSGGGIPRDRLPHKHDTILWYAKGERAVYHPIYRPYSEGTVARGRTAVKGADAKLRDAGTPTPDWWADVKKITSPTDREKLDYPTQKSEALLERIVQMASNPGDLVLDAFSGSGTTLAVARRLGRRAIAIDRHEAAVELTVRRGLGVASEAGLVVHRMAPIATSAPESLALRRDEDALVIDRFEPAPLLARLGWAEAGARWPRLVDAIYVDPEGRDGALRPSLTFVPPGDELVPARLALPATSVRVRVRVVDRLGHAWEARL